MSDHHVLMISLDPALADVHSEAFARHRAYAERIGRLTIITRVRAGRVTPIAVGGLTVQPIAAPRLIDYARVVLLRPPAIARPIDLIVTQDLFVSGWIGLRLRARLRAPLLVQNHSYIFGNRAWIAEHPLRNRALLRLATYVRARADFYRAVNQVERDRFIAAGGPPERAAALPLGTASRAFAAPTAPEVIAACRQELGLHADDQVVLWVGYPVAFKRVPLLLKAFRQIGRANPRARLVIIGDLARSPHDLPALAADLAIADRVIFAGPRPHADLPAYYQLADVYAHTSSYEGVPRVLFEAGAAGLPLVGMRAVGVDEVILDGQTGYLVEDGDSDAFAERALLLLTDPGLRQRLGAAAREHCLTHFDAETYPDRWVGLWRRAIELGPRR
jgi:glycosyltransferase involved in cell wall biosynthesis